MHLFVPDGEKASFWSILKNWVYEWNMFNAVQFTIHFEISKIWTKMITSMPFLSIKSLNPLIENLHEEVNLFLFRFIQELILCIFSFFFIFKIKMNWFEYFPEIQWSKITEFSSHFNLFKMARNWIKLNFLFKWEKRWID